MYISVAIRRASVLGAASAFALLFSVAASSAATFSIVGGSGFTLPSSGATYDPNTSSGPTPTTAQTVADGVGQGTMVTSFGPGITAGQGLFVSPQNVTLSFEFIGKEAGDLDAALTFLNSTLLLNTENPGTIATGSFNVGSAPGLVPLKFVDQSLSEPGTAKNGGPIDTKTAIAFYIVPRTNNSVVYAFFDDGGAGPDKDYDDMVLRITATATPLPAALPLFASGLGALGLLGWRRKRKASLVA